MTPARRWCLVAVGVLLLVSAPLAVNAWPASDPDIGAEALAEKARASADVAYSGYAEAVGGLALPTTDQFNEVADLFGASNRLRVWWRDSDDWRVDRLGTAGESDLFHAGTVTSSWNYESRRATNTPDGLVFLPRTVDLLPPQLARLVLADAAPDELTRIPAERIAGHDAAGLRLTPAAPQASIDHVDMWIEPESGLPLRVQVWGNDEPAPAMDTGFADLSLGQPESEATVFEPPPSADVSFGGVGGDSLLGHIPAVFRSPRLGGLATVEVGASTPISRYGRGVTQMLVLGLDDEVADPLREQLSTTAGAVVDGRGTALAAGPLHLLLSPCLGDRPSWLLVGTVDGDTLRRASRRVYPAAIDGTASS